MAGKFPLEKQLQDKWCWAAIATGVDHYFFPGSSSTQCTVAKSVLNTADCCSKPESCNKTAKLQDALDKLGLVPKIYTEKFTFKQIRKVIDAGSPVCARIAWNAGGAHFVVICGYRIAASGAEIIEIADPYFPSSLVLYDDFLEAYQNAEQPQGGGRWVASFLVKPEKGCSHGVA